MKNFYLSLFAAVALLAVGCNPTPDTGGDEPTPTPDSGAKLKEFVVNIANPISRAAVGDNRVSTWSADDEVTILRFDPSATRPKLVQCTIDSNSINGSSAKFTTLGYINEVGEQYAVYPDDKSKTINPNLSLYRAS